MPQAPANEWQLEDYDRAAQEYLHSLPLEHFMEATAQATQREITLASLALLKARRDDVQVCNELLIQLRLAGETIQVVPDNMVIRSRVPMRAVSSFNVALEPAGPFWVLEYVSESNRRKDYEESFEKYERYLRVPYCLIFDPDHQELRLYRHTGSEYTLLEPDTADRLPIPELDLEVGLLDGWVRFWYQGELLLLPADLQQEADELGARLQEATRRMRAEKRRADKAEKESERERLRADQAERESGRERLRADQEKQRADEAIRQTERERQRLESLQAELAQLRALLAERQPPPNPEN